MESAEFGERITALLQREVGEGLRSIVGYTRDSHAIHYLRDDVARDYDDDAFARALDELRLETLEKEYINDLFRGVHGEFECRIDLFGEAVEMNFALGTAEGLEVAVDRNSFTDPGTLVGQILDLIDEYYERAGSDGGR